MTTIVYDGKTVACDTAQFNQNLRGHHGPKIFRLVNPRTGLHEVVGYTNEPRYGKALMHWYSTATEENFLSSFPESATSDNATLLVFAHGAPVRCYTTTPFPDTFPEDAFYAAGSGRDFALGALAFGATAAQAVNCAIIHDCWTGGQVYVLELFGNPMPDAAGNAAHKHRTSPTEAGIAATLASALSTMSVRQRKVDGLEGSLDPVLRQAEAALERYDQAKSLNLI